MVWNRRFSMSLAKKTSLLFGTAVLLTITVTLAFPWQQMRALQEQAMLLQGKRIASAAAQAVDLYVPDWAATQQILNTVWPTIAHRLDLPMKPPRLVPVEHYGPGFLAEAVAHLNRNNEHRYYWRIQQGGVLFRLAVAVRAPDTDRHPDRLLGLIDVRLPVEENLGIWNWTVTVLAGASGAMLAILAFYMVTQRLVLTPVRALRRVAEKVTSGDIEVRASLNSRDEFQHFAEAFNEMLAHLKAAHEEQQKINKSLDIKLGELAETNVALYESARLKSDFLANVTHELRTPLVSIIGFAELLHDAAQGADVDRHRLERYTRNILNSGRGLLDLINDLLDLAKIEAGKFELHLSEFSIDELCRDLIDFVQPLADKRNQQLRLEVEPDLPRFKSDAGRVKQVLYNLLSNAIKFSPTGGSIELFVERNGDARVRLKVKDSGPGIPEEDRPLIFEKFRQLDSSRTREHTGSGLGLAITRELVEALQGAIELESVVGQGCTFMVTLPVSPAKAFPTSPTRLT
jgi:two-component system, NarL family, sensor histidine kinase BarA